MTSCDNCIYNEYDEDYEDYVCSVNMDEDDLMRFMSAEDYNCPYYQLDDEYKIARKQ